MNKAQWLNAYNDMSEQDKVDANALIAKGISEQCYGLITPLFVKGGIAWAMGQLSVDGVQKDG